MAAGLVIPGDDVKEENFSFPGGTTVQLRKKNLSELKELLRDYKLTLAGNKAQVLQRLIDFSGNPSAWNSLVAGHRRPHKGPREVTNNATTSPDHDKKPKKKSQVNVRRDELMGERPPNEPAHVVQRSKDTRTRQEKDELHAWAKQFRTNTPDMRKPWVPIKAAENPKPALDSRLATIEGQLQALLSAKSELQTRLLGTPANANMDASMPPPHPVSTSSSTVVGAPRHLDSSSTQDVVHSFQSLGPHVPPPSTSPTPSPTPPLSLLPVAIPPPAPDIEMVNAQVTELKKLLILGNGTRLEFLSSDVADPLALSFAKDIPKLSRVWDDCRADFSPSECTLRIKGHAIALKHWPVAYSYSQDSRWTGIKKKWGTWKWIADRYNQSTPENFWAEFYDHEHDQRMTFTAIDNHLRKQRKKSDQLTVEQQREQLGVDFSQQFQVRGKPMVCASAIAKRAAKKS
ncbi:hypothetical protein BDP27DRAFT_1431769 [Rhodocollybia butyracea]|uniref:SAP domain-containing protein n=1 Tax=Rhodocollybia butyracea TaxID=206335 RepID=A0A9P5TYF2_9AGAR|nr:hypothetical protein BDP27DRAFT_1431769 [Rhodocollybia butyracea]